MEATERSINRSQLNDTIYGESRRRYLVGGLGNDILMQAPATDTFEGLKALTRLNSPAAAIWATKLFMKMALGHARFFSQLDLGVGIDTDLL